MKNILYKVAKNLVLSGTLIYSAGCSRDLTPTSISIVDSTNTTRKVDVLCDKLILREKCVVFPIDANKDGKADDYLAFPRDSKGAKYLLKKCKKR